MGREAVCLINLKSAKAIPTAGIKGQCVKWKFYGETDDLENAFNALETKVTKIMRSIILGAPLSTIGTDEHFYLLFFLATQWLRTPNATQQGTEQASLVMTYYAKEYGKRAGVDIGDARIVFSDDTAIALGALEHVLPAVWDLDTRILRTRCNAHFITSDNPVIFYNQWCEGIDYTGVTGALNNGLQIFYPLAPNCLLMLFDHTVYEVSGQNMGDIFLTDSSDVNYINRLPCLFAQENLFFSNWNDRHRILGTLAKISHLRSSHEITLHVAQETLTKRKSSTKSELLHMFTPMPNASFKLNFSNICHRAQHIPIEDRAQMYRDIPPQVMNTKASKAIEARLQGKKWFTFKSKETWRKD